MEYYNTNICALATPGGQGAIAVIRLSGEDTPEIVGKIFSPAGGKAPLPYKMQFGAIKNNDRLYFTTKKFGGHSSQRSNFAGNHYTNPLRSNGK